MSEKEPAHLSIQLKNKIRWMAVSGVLRIIFNVDGFPVLTDGTKVMLPPLSGMVLNQPKTKWFTSGLTGSVNPDLLALLPRAPDHQLVYKYRVLLGEGEVSAFLVIQE